MYAIIYVPPLSYFSKNAKAFKRLIANTKQHPLWFFNKKPLIYYLTYTPVFKEKTPKNFVNIL